MSGKLTGKKVVIPAFSLTETCEKDDPGAIKRSIAVIDEQPAQNYYFRPVAAEREAGRKRTAKWVRQEFNWFPLILDQNDQPWDVAVVYFLSKLQGLVAPNMTTFQGIADDLAAFLAFLEEYGIDFTEIPQHKLKRPTYRFHGYLKNLVFEGRIAATTAKRRMGAVIAFYRWLVAEGLLTPSNPLWQERDHYLSFKDARGFVVEKVVKTTDVTIKTPKQDDPYTESIKDGGKLQPLTIQEQKWLVEALAHLGNVEMTLIHAFMLATGARIQTTLTLRLKHVMLDPPDGLAEIRFPVGPTTGVDTKHDKLTTLYIPRWLYERLRIYSHSERARKRRTRADGGDTADQYLFLSQQGNPYYQSKRETHAFDPTVKVHHQKRGQTVRTFITEHVIPYIRKHCDPAFRYQPHDLRATFGMNLTDIQLAMVQRGEISLTQARDFVRTRMGHESSATTDLYLGYRRTLKMVYEAVDAHEQYFRELIERAWEGTVDLT
ncbi:tyrosine-type recombinase/integrase [Cupriavidus taiwanensis]|uniref:Putative phage head-tail adaptor n=1 Tax=Cupriavidus taiwanensis TaxID=164546 RepID=A0A7Z7JEQ4_9BURK|nr:site-specific integrase [Cupriavidus taiwanensis]SOZ16393.1 putative phage head-tail adaptor [Cupriavidus taiwanensis]SOZ95299.1 putative phage head-tail adaptor [Cupriavidus taiwanensis]SPC25216.1 putative phage head-tail adaptor [Cupriavidus taiwanensis]SPD37132.1 putative phage head-tail adaptor [Cupriavidus taiwanensis]SPD37791.1 putative phage head-tail adaptor [Cupriavidus taiwanensis]